MSKIIMKKHKNINVDNGIYKSAEDEAMGNINVPVIDKNVYISAEDEAMGNINVPVIDKNVYVSAEDEALKGINIVDKNDYDGAEDEALKGINIIDKHNYVSAEDEALKGINIIDKNNYVSAEDEALKGINIVDKNNYISAENEALKGINIVDKNNYISAENEALKGINIKPNPINISIQESQDDITKQYPKISQLKDINKQIQEIDIIFSQTPTTINNKNIITKLKQLATSLDNITVKNIQIITELDKMELVNNNITDDNIKNIKDQLNILFKALQVGKGVIVELIKKHLEFYKNNITLLTNLQQKINVSNRIDNNFIMIYFLIHLVGDELNNKQNYYDIKTHIDIYKLLKFIHNYYKVIDEDVYDLKMEELKMIDDVYVGKIKNDIDGYIKSGKKFSDMKMDINDYLIILNREKDNILM